MAQDPVPFIPTEPLATDGSAWGMRAFFKQILYWAKRLCGVSTPQTASFTADENFFFPVDASAGAVTVTLPAAATWTPGKPYIVKKTDSTTNTVTIQRSGTDTFDGATSVVIRAQYGLFQFVSNGVSTWHLVQGSTAAASQYVEGTFTPSYTAVTTPPTVSYTIQTGWYTKIGRLCFFNIRIVVNVLTAAGLGQLQITGLPFAAGNNAQGVANITMSSGWINAPGAGVVFSAGGTLLYLFKAFTTGATAGADLANGCDLWVSGWYQTQ